MAGTLWRTPSSLSCTRRMSCSSECMLCNSLFPHLCFCARLGVGIARRNFQASQPCRILRTTFPTRPLCCFLRFPSLLRLASPLLAFASPVYCTPVPTTIRRTRGCQQRTTYITVTYLLSQLGHCHLFNLLRASPLPHQLGVAPLEKRLELRRLVGTTGRADVIAAKDGARKQSTTWKLFAGSYVLHLPA